MKKLFAIVCVFALFLTSFLFTACIDEAKVEYKLSEDGTYYIVDKVSGDTSALKSYDVPAEYSAEEGGEKLPVKEIGDEAFMNCSALYNITLPDSIERIGVRAFMNCGFSSIIIPDKVECIDSAAFGKCVALKKIVIPQSVTTIGVLAFAYCSGLECVVIEAQITNLPAKAFCNSYAVVSGNVYTSTALTRIYLPSSLEKIHTTAFEGNFLTDIHFAGDKEQWDKLYFYEYVIKEGTEDQLEEKKTSSSDVITSDIIHFNSAYQSAE